MPLGTEVGVGLRDIVFDVDPATPRKKVTPTPTKLLAHVYCGQTSGWIKMALDMEVGLGPVHIVLDGDTAPSPKKGQSPPIFGPFLLLPNRWMHQLFGYSGYSAFHPFEVDK